MRRDRGCLAHDGGTGPLRFLAGMVGTDHIVYGTDFPFDMAAGPLADQLAGTGLAPADTELIAGRNAAALFGVPD